MQAQAGAPAPVPVPAQGPAVIPEPQHISPGAGQLRLGSHLVISAAAAADAGARRAAHDLAQFWASAAPGLPPARIASGETVASVVLERADPATAAEGYRLTVTPHGVRIAASTEAGWFYGGVTLAQLVHPAADGAQVIDAQQIEDAPRLPWRGVMLDSARHFQSPRFIAHLIDWMALHKLNILHWHLTDDQGWRLQIRRYPQLTAIGAWRVPAGPAAAADLDPATGQPRRYGGFYTQAQVRALVAHAARRGVSIVPEIDMPGHASAALASYPQLGVRPDLVPAVPADWGIFMHVYSPQESSLRFLENVLQEVTGLFPGPYVHIGGDEVSLSEWQQDPATARRLQALGLSDAEQLRHYFTSRMQGYLTTQGRRAVGWDEVLVPGLSPRTVVMSWRGVEGARAAVLQGNDAVLSPDPQLYFDHRQGTGLDEPPGRVAVISVQDVYGFEPVPDGLTLAQQQHVLGLQANLWTEHIRTEARVAAMAFPRLAALAEVGWSAPDRRNWPDFERRLAGMLPRYRALGLPFDQSLFGVSGRVDYAPDGSEAQVVLQRQADYGVLRYSLDGHDPTGTSTAYSGPLAVHQGSEVRAASFDGATALSSVSTFVTRAGLVGRRQSGELELCSNAVPLALEDDAPLRGPRAVFTLDIEHPCWTWPSVDLDHVASVVAAVGQVPFNFQIGADLKKISFPVPETAAGELEVHLDGCDGALYVRLPLAPAAASNAVTVLPPAAVPKVSGTHDLCLRFAQRGVNPLWALDFIELRTAAPTAAPWM